MLFQLSESTLFYRNLALEYISGSHPVGFKTDVKKWSAAVVPRGPPASASTTSRARSALISAKSSTLANRSTTKQQQKEPEPELLDEDTDHYGLSDDNAEDLARERESFCARTGADAIQDVVELSSPAPSPPPLSQPRPFTQVPRERSSSPLEDITSPGRRLSSPPERLTSPPELLSSLKRRRADSAAEGEDHQELGDAAEEHDEEMGEEHDKFQLDAMLGEDIVPDSEPESEPAAKNRSRTTDMGDVDIQPAKRLKQETSKAIVKNAKGGRDEDAKGDKDTDINKVKATGKRQKKYNKNTLPPYARVNGRWRLVFVPTFLAWLGSQKEVWGPSNSKILSAIRAIWRVVYDEELPSEHNSIDGAVFALCKQRGNDWRSNFGSTAAAVLTLSFAEQNMYGDEEAVEHRIEYASGLLVGNAFMYENVPEDGTQPTGNFRGPMYATTLATHRSAIRGRVKVPEFDNKEYYVPRGAMTLACAAAERACQLAVDGQLGDLEPVLDGVAAFQASGSGGCPVNKAKILLQTNSKGRKQVNERTGKPSTSLANFSEANWKWATDLYWKGIVSKDDEYLADAFKATETHARNMRRGNEFDDEDEDEDEEMDHAAHADPRAMLPQN